MRHWPLALIRRIPLAALFFAAVMMVAPLAVQAQGTSKPFACDGTFFLALGKTGKDPAQLLTVDTSSTPYTLVPVGTTSPGIKYNAISFNNQDGLIYGINPVSGEVYRVGADGVTTSMGKPPGLPRNRFSGDVATDTLIFW